MSENRGMALGFSALSQAPATEQAGSMTVAMQESCPQAGSTSDYFQDKPEIRMFM